MISLPTLIPTVTLATPVINVLPPVIIPLVNIELEVSAVLTVLLPMNSLPVSNVTFDPTLTPTVTFDVPVTLVLPLVIVPLVNTAVELRLEFTEVLPM